MGAGNYDGGGGGGGGGGGAASSSNVVPYKRPKTNKYAIGCGILASMSSIILGYDIGVMSGAVIYIQKDLKISDVQVEILAGILNVYSLLGSAAAGRTSDLIGRRFTIMVASVIFFVGALLMGFATNYAFLMVGRFVAGIGVGYGMMIAPVYTAEVSPPSQRGLLTSLPEVFINVGILLGYVSNIAFSGLSYHLSWRFMLGIGALPSVCLGIAVMWMPESARWLVLQGRVGEARKVLYKISDTEEEAELRLNDIKEAAGIPADSKEDVVVVPKRKQGGGDVWKELLLHPTPSVRRVMIAAIGLHFFQQTSGIDAVVLYSPRIFKSAGIQKESALLGATVAVGVVKTLSILIATFTLDRRGRRPLLLASLGGMVLSLFFLGTGLTVVDQHPGQTITWAVFLSVIMVMVYVSAFSLGMGPIVWVYSSEVFPLRLRAQGASMGVGVNRVMSGMISMTFLSLSKAITTGGSFLLFCVIAMIAWIFVFFFLPETQGRTLEEMENLFEHFNWRTGKNRGGGVIPDRNGGDNTNKQGQVEMAV